MRSALTPLFGPWLARCAGLALLVALALPGVARAVEAHLEMDAQQLQVGEMVALRLVVTGGSADSVPRLPEIAPLRFAFQRPERQIVSINFRTTVVMTYTWSATAVQAGEARIGPLQITVGGAPLKVAPLRVVVSMPAPGRSGTRQVTAHLEPTPEGLAEGAPVPLWLGQTVVYRFSFAYAESVLDARWSQPEFTGFTAAPGVGQAQRDYALQRAGQSWTVHDVDVPLVATSPGTGEIAPSVINAQVPAEAKRPRRRTGDPFFDEFFGRSMFQETAPLALASQPIPVQVRPLPTTGKPEGFSGLVGTFDVDMALGARQVRAGDSVTLTVTVRGDGSLAGLKLPPAPSGAGYRTYDDDPEVEAGIVGGKYSATAVLRRAVVPTEEGHLELPPPVLTWFDPALGRYQAYQGPPLSIEVLPGEPGQQELTTFATPAAPAPQEVASLGEDILPAHTDTSVRDRRLRPLRPLPILALGLPGLALLWQIALDLRVRGGARSRRLAAVKARLASLPEPRAERLAALEGAFREAAGLALGLPPAGVEPARLRAGLPEPLAERAAALYGRLESARFAGADVGDLERAVRALVPELLGRAR
ncbi:MAG: BatD family protein [Pseudomonadota bacterium]